MQARMKDTDERHGTSEAAPQARLRLSDFLFCFLGGVT